MPVAEELKRGRFSDALKDLAEEKARIIRLLVSLLAEYGVPYMKVDDRSGTKASSTEMSEKALAGVATMLVDEPAAKEFYPILTTIVERPNMVFGILTSDKTLNLTCQNSSNKKIPNLSYEPPQPNLPSRKAALNPPVSAPPHLQQKRRLACSPARPLIIHSGLNRPCRLCRFNARSRQWFGR